MPEVDVNKLVEQVGALQAISFLAGVFLLFVGAFVIRQWITIRKIRVEGELKEREQDASRDKWQQGITDRFHTHVEERIQEQSRRFERLESEFKEYRKTAEQQIEDLESQVFNRETVISGLQSQLTTLRARYEQDMTDLRVRLEGEIADLREAMARMADEVVREHNAFEVEHDRATSLDIRVNDLTNMNARLVSDNVHLIESNNHLSDQVAALTRKLANLQTDMIVVDERSKRVLQRQAETDANLQLPPYTTPSPDTPT